MNGRGCYFVARVRPTVRATTVVPVELPRPVRSLPSHPTTASIDDALPDRERRVFRLVRRAARQALRRRIRVVRIAGRAYAKLARHESTLHQVRTDLLTLLRLARAWAQREYRGVPWRSLLYGVAALLYFVTPFDAVPDVLLVLGLADDIAIITVVVRALRSDLDAFTAWEHGLGADLARTAEVAPSADDRAPLPATAIAG